MITGKGTRYLASLALIIIINFALPGSCPIR